MSFKILFALAMLCLFKNKVNGLGGGFTDIGVAIGSATSNSCGTEAGCHKGKCWTWCGLSLSSGEWCYTTKGKTWDGGYISCSDDWQCGKCWKCAGACALF